MVQIDPTIKKPELSRRAFWDIDLSSLDFDRYPEFTVVRAMERGTFKDIREVIRYYGQNKIRSIVINADRLLPRALIISRRLFNIHNSDFKCSTAKRQATNFSMF